MKKLLVVLLSLGLLVAFGATASAVDVKFSGSYYVVGLYENNPTLSNMGYSNAFFYQRIRIQPVFQIAEGLSFTARMDAMEKQWGQTDYKGNSTYMGLSTPDDLTATRGNSITKVPKRGIQESFEWERGWVSFATKFGRFDVGYQNVDDWGTDFGDYSNSRPKISFTTQVGPMILGVAYEKVFESTTAAPGILAAASGANTYLADGTKVYATAPATLAFTGLVDADKDTYALYGIYKFKGGEAGLLYKYYVYANFKAVGIKQQFSQISPYVKATIGPVFVESEMTYWFGKYAQFELPNSVFPAGTPDIDLQAWSFYIKGRMNVGAAYFGALYAYASGDDLSDKTKVKTAPSGGGTNFAPALILGNDALATWTGGNSAAASPWNKTSVLCNTHYNVVTSSKYNTIFYNVFGGFNVTPQLNIEAALTYATVDKKALQMAWSTGVVTEAVSDKLGTEFDIKATYKIYDNLSYMVGMGYLWTGDYFKGSSSTTQIDNNYLLINQLTLSF
jgi:hypothetical protein